MSKPLFDNVERGLERSDDSFDAAMRAADALFSRIAPDDEDASAPASSPRETFDDAVNGKAGGRILRALDEPPAPEPAALDADHVPKRRGRKPGSKNKPKIRPAELFDFDDGSDFDDGVEADATPAVAPVSHGAPDAKSVPSIDAAVMTALRRGTRASWRRDKLKPWEGWKRRRLPRICW